MIAPTEHVYLSTSCLHGLWDEDYRLHQRCQSNQGADGPKRPAECKFCPAPCLCPCHREPAESHLGEQLFTLEQARQLLAEEHCLRDGHDIQQLREGARIVALGCLRCNATFVPLPGAGVSVTPFGESQ